ncbi:MAG: RidA family protein [Chloroflexota bacterium]
MTNSTPEERIAELGIALPTPGPAGGIYKSVVISGNHAYVSGTVSLDGDGNPIKGRAGDDLTTEQAKEAARMVAIHMISKLKIALGELSRVERLVKTLGMVNCTPDFGEQPLVINGYSEVMRDVFGEDKGIGARSAVGMMLPFNFAVEIEAIFELKPE